MLKSISFAVQFATPRVKHTLSGKAGGKAGKGSTNAEGKPSDPLGLAISLHEQLTILIKAELNERGEAVGFKAPASTTFKEDFAAIRSKEQS